MARFLSSGDTALTIELGDTADLATSARVLALWRRISAQHVAGVVEVVPAIAALTVHYDPNGTSADVLTRQLAPMLAAAGAPVPALEPERRWLLPVCYDADLALDLDEVAAHAGLTRERAIELHAGAAYRVYMVGFLPGHPYMGDLPEPLRLPRRTSPRTSVPLGSVAIATNMCVIYPQHSPGGWNIVGRTPVRLFDARREPAALLGPGDEVRFRQVGRVEFEEIEREAATRAWCPEPHGGGAAR